KSSWNISSLWGLSQNVCCFVGISPERFHLEPAFVAKPGATGLVVKQSRLRHILSIKYKLNDKLKFASRVEGKPGLELLLSFSPRQKFAILLKWHGAKPHSHRALLIPHLIPDNGSAAQALRKGPSFAK